MLIKTLISLALLCLFVQTGFAQTFHRKPRKSSYEGSRLIVIDSRLAALRERPDIKAALIVRLSRGRTIGYLGQARNGYLAVSVSRNTRGWISAAAVVKPGIRDGAALLISLLEEITDEYQRAKLAQMLLIDFPQFRPRALLVIGQAADSAAEKLSRDSVKRYGDTDAELILNYPGLDRYNRLGITFDFVGGKLVYDCAAYREIIRRYPNSPESFDAMSRLRRSPHANQREQGANRGR